MYLSNRICFRNDYVFKSCSRKVTRVGGWLSRAIYYFLWRSEFENLSNDCVIFRNLFVPIAPRYYFVGFEFNRPDWLLWWNGLVRITSFRNIRLGGDLSCSCRYLPRHKQSQGASGWIHSQWQSLDSRQIGHDEYRQFVLFQKQVLLIIILRHRTAK